MAKPKKFCAKAGCNTLIDFDKTYCDKHKSKYQWRKSYEGKYLQFYHSKEWKKQSKLFLLQNSLCVKCLADGIVKKADVVDHIVPLKDDWSKRLDWNNWQPLCQYHHNEKTRAEQYSKPCHNLPPTQIF